MQISKIMNRISTLLFFFLLPLFCNAATLEDALNEAAMYLAKTAVKLEKSHEIVIEVVNYHSDKKDQIARNIETELYFALEKQFPEFKLILLSETIAGISNKNAVYIKGTYEQKGNETDLKLQALKGMSGIILAQKEVQFDNVKTVEQTLVAVLDIESSDLSMKQKKVFSEIFRSKLSQTGVFNLASSADINRMDPDAIQKTSGCSRDECATIIGEQLGVDRVISSSVFKVDKSKYVLSAKVIDIKDGSLQTSRAVDHNGSVSNIGTSLGILAEKLTEGSKVSNIEKSTLIEQNKSLQESLYWQAIKDSKKISDYKDFLSKYPNGIYARLAKDKIVNIEELRDWSLLKDSDEIDKFATFVDLYPEGANNNEARHKIEDLNNPSNGFAWTLGILGLLTYSISNEEPDVESLEDCSVYAWQWEIDNCQEDNAEEEKENEEETKYTEMANQNKKLIAFSLIILAFAIYEPEDPKYKPYYENLAGKESESNWRIEPVMTGKSRGGIRFAVSF